MTGRGFGFGTFAGTQSAIVADVEVNEETGKIVAKHLYISQNNGVTIGPDLVGNQMSGSAIQGLSRAMYEQVTFTKERITSLDWVTYPILRFKESPKVTLVNVHPGVYTTVNPGDFTTDKNPGTDVSKGNTAAFNQGWNALRLGRAADGSDRLGRRERVLRCHGCPHPPGADEPDARPRCPQGSGDQVTILGSNAGGPFGALPPFRVVASVPQARRSSLLLAAVAVAPGAPAADLPSLYVDYHEDCTFRLTNDNGATVTQVAPSIYYQIVVATPSPFAGIYHPGANDLVGCNGNVKFRLTGPGVSVTTTLDGGDGQYEVFSAKFEAGSTYTFQDDSNVNGTRRTVVASGPPPAVDDHAARPARSRATPKPEPVDKTLRGTLAGSVTTAGKLALTLKGKPVTTLKPGATS